VRVDRRRVGKVLMQVVDISVGSFALAHTGPDRSDRGLLDRDARGVQGGVRLPARQQELFNRETAYIDSGDTS
jgi:hypothetical protein